MLAGCAHRAPLSGRRSVMPNFRPLVVSAMLSSLLGLAACGGGGGYGGGNNPPSGAAPSKLFAADSTDRVVGSLANPNPAAGSLTVDRTIGPTSPYFFNNARFSTNIGSVAVDTTNNILYVSNENSTTHQISVFDNADAVTTAAPSRTITPTVSTVNQPVGGISLDAAHDLLYVAPGSGGNGIMVFTASTASGSIPPAKTLTITSAPGILSVLVGSANDRLYAVGSNGHIYLIEAVRTLLTGAAAAKDASLSNGGMLTAVAVNPN